jgi:hypothetical protein
MRSQKVRLTRAVPDPPPSVLRVSCHPLDGFLPFAPCRTCFRPAAPGVFPSERSPRRSRSDIPAASCPACRYHRPSFDEPFGLSEVRACRSTPGYFLGRIPCVHSRCLARCGAGCSPGVYSSQGSSSIHPDRSSPTDAPLTHLVIRMVAHALQSGASEFSGQFDSSSP